MTKPQPGQRFRVTPTPGNESKFSAFTTTVDRDGGYDGRLAVESGFMTVTILSPTEREQAAARVRAYLDVRAKRYSVEEDGISVLFDASDEHRLFASDLRLLAGPDGETR